MSKSAIAIVLFLILVAYSESMFIKHLFKSYDEYTKNEELDFTSMVLMFVNQTKPWLPGCVISLVKEHPEVLVMDKNTE